MKTMMRTSVKTMKTTKVAIIVVLVLLAADWFYLRQVQRQSVVNVDKTVVYDRRELAKYDGSDASKPIYLALEGYVYDVTQGGADFYGEGQAYHYLAGKDASIPLQLFGSEIVKNKYHIVGIYRP
jgi:predicted heme/steroid binding protein